MTSPVQTNLKSRPGFVSIFINIDIQYESFELQGLVVFKLYASIFEEYILQQKMTMWVMRCLCRSRQYKTHGKPLANHTLSVKYARLKEITLYTSWVI